jgi:hypothetical protein
MRVVEWTFSLPNGVVVRPFVKTLGLRAYVISMLSMWAKEPVYPLVACEPRRAHDPKYRFLLNNVSVCGEPVRATMNNTSIAEP